MPVAEFDDSKIFGFGRNARREAQKRAPAGLNRSEAGSWKRRGGTGRHFFEKSLLTWSGGSAYKPPIETAPPLSGASSALHWNARL
jgi:hypothetical protein